MIIERRCPTCKGFLTVVGSDELDILRRVKGREGEVHCARCDLKLVLANAESTRIEENLSKAKRPG